MAPDALYGLGWSHLELKRQAGAVDAFRQLVDTFPDSPRVPSARVELARILIELKRNGEAITYLRDFGQKHRGHRLEPEARYLLAFARVADGQVSEGLSDLRDFLGAYPTHPLAPQARRNLVDLLLRQGKQTALQDEYQRLMAAQPRTAESLYDAGFIATRIGRARDAEAAWTALRTDFPRSALAGRASLDLADGAYRKNAFKEAATYARTAAGSEEPAVRAEGALMVGESELKLKRFPAALEAFRAAVEAAAPDSLVRYRALAGAGLAHEEQKQWADAARSYDEVAAGSPDKELRAWAKTRRAAIGAKLKPAAPAPKDKRR
jgi:TolA-binding protein